MQSWYTILYMDQKTFVLNSYAGFPNVTYQSICEGIDNWVVLVFLKNTHTINNYIQFQKCNATQYIASAMIYLKDACHEVKRFYQTRLSTADICKFRVKNHSKNSYFREQLYIKKEQLACSVSPDTLYR